MSATQERRTDFTERLSGRLARTTAGKHGAAVARELRRRVVPLHWTNLFGVVAVACLVVITVTGIVLMFTYTPSNTTVVYEGPYPTLVGAQVSEAFASTMHLSFEMPGGLLIRQAHHWAALLLPAAIIAQLLVTYFTGAFRRPRRAGWVLLFLLLIAALAGGWSGYALPDDMLSGTGLRIVEGIVLGIPFVGTPLKSLLFGGEFPGDIVANLYPLHLAVIPIMVVLGLVRLALLFRYQPPQFAGPGRTRTNVVGVPLWPNAVARAGGLLLIVMGVLTLISATVTINPIWLYGPASPGDAGAGSQPDWYTGFLDGALRLVPPGWEFVAFDRTWTLAVLVPLAVIGAYLLLVAVYPFVEEWILGDHRDHHLLDRPRNTPTRTGIGVAGIVFYGVLWGAASADVVAAAFSVTIEGVVLAFQIMLLTGPVVAFAITRRVCLGLQRRDRDVLLHGYETGRIVRLPGGEYLEVHRPVDAHDRWRLVDVDRPTTAAATTAPNGRPVARLRARLARFFLESRLEPVDPSHAVEARHDSVDSERDASDARIPAG